MSSPSVLVTASHLLLQAVTALVSHTPDAPGSPGGSGGGGSCDLCGAAVASAATARRRGRGVTNPASTLAAAAQRVEVRSARGQGRSAAAVALTRAVPLAAQVAHVTAATLPKRLTRAVAECGERRVLLVCGGCLPRRVARCPHCAARVTAEHVAVLHQIVANDWYPCCLARRASTCDGCVAADPTRIFLPGDIVKVDSARSTGLPVCTVAVCHDCLAAQCPRCWRCRQAFTLLEIHRLQLAQASFSINCPHCDSPHHRCETCFRLVVRLPFALHSGALGPTGCPADSLHYAGSCTVHMPRSIANGKGACTGHARPAALKELCLYAVIFMRPPRETEACRLPDDVQQTLWDMEYFVAHWPPFSP